MLENHFSAGDASLEEKERALYADAAPGDQKLLLHYPDGREAESLEQSPAGAPSAANGQGSEPEASLSNTSAAESAPPGDAEGPGEEEEGPPAAGSLPPGGVEGPEEERPEFSSGGEPGQEVAGPGLPTEGAARMEAEVQEGSKVPEELQGILGDSPIREAAAGTAESVATQVSLSTEGEEVLPVRAEGEGNTGSDHQSTELDGTQEATPAGDEPEADMAAQAKEGAEDQPQDHSLQPEDEAITGPDHQPTDLHAVSNTVSSGVEAEEAAEESKAEGDTEASETAEDQGEPRPSQEPDSAIAASEKSEDTQSSEARETENYPLEGEVSGMPEEGQAEASSEEEGGEEGESEEGGVPSKEESEEDSGDGASSEEKEDIPGEAGEPQIAPGTTSQEEKAAQLDVEDRNTESEGSKTQDTEAEASEERQQGRGDPVITRRGRN